MTPIDHLADIKDLGKMAYVWSLESGKLILNIFRTPFHIDIGFQGWIA